MLYVKTESKHVRNIKSHCKSTPDGRLPQHHTLNTFLRTHILENKWNDGFYAPQTYFIHQKSEHYSSVKIGIIKHILVLFSF